MTDPELLGLLVAAVALLALDLGAAAALWASLRRRRWDG